MASFKQQSGQRRIAGFTIVEVSVASALLMIIMGTILALSVMSLRKAYGVSAQLKLNSQLRVMNLMVTEIKTSRQVDIRNYNGVTITNITTGQPLQGNAVSLMIQSGGGTMNQIIYWVNSTGKLLRTVFNDGSSKTWVDDVTTLTPFTARDYSGTILTVPTQRMLIDIRVTAVDSNTRDFRQTITQRVSVNKRN